MIINDTKMSNCLIDNFCDNINRIIDTDIVLPKEGTYNYDKNFISISTLFNI